MRILTSSEAKGLLIKLDDHKEPGYDLIRDEIMLKFVYLGGKWL